MNRTFLSGWYCETNASTAGTRAQLHGSAVQVYVLLCFVHESVELTIVNMLNSVSLMLLCIHIPYKCCGSRTSQLMIVAGVVILVFIVAFGHCRVVSFVFLFSSFS